MFADVSDGGFADNVVPQILPMSVVMAVENHCATGSMPCNDATVPVDSNSTVCPGDRTEPIWTTVVAKTKSKNMQRPPRRQGPT